MARKANTAKASGAEQAPAEIKTRPEMDVTGAELVANKSGTYSKVQVDGTTIGVLYPRKSTFALYLAPDFAKLLSKSLRDKMDSQPGNGRYSERLKDAQPKQVQAVIDAAAKSLAAQAEKEGE